MRGLFAVIAFSAIVLSAGAAAGKTNSRATATIPPQFHGLWDGYAQACELSSSDMRLSVDASQLRFWETFGSVRSVARIDDQTISARVKSTSEGESWTENVRMTLSRDGTALTIRRNDNSTTRVRCAKDETR